MSIINCPECQNNISSTAQHCVHCGYEFQICTECAAVLRKDLTICEECGYVLSNSKKNVLESEFSSASNCIKKWESESTIRNIYINNQNPIKLFILCSIVFLIIAVMKLFLWSTGNPAEGILNFQNTQDSITTLCIISGISIFIFSFLSNFRCYYYPISLGNWAQINKINLPNIILTYMNSNFDGLTLEQISIESVCTANIIKTMTYKDDMLVKIKEQKRFITTIVLSGISIALLYFFFISNSNMYMDFILWKTRDSNFEFSMIKNWWAFVISVIIVIVKSIYSSRMEKLEDKDSDDWVKKNLPEYYEKYDKHIKNFMDYLLDEAEKNELT